MRHVFKVSTVLKLWHCTTSVGVQPMCAVKLHLLEAIDANYGIARPIYVCTCDFKMLLTARESWLQSSHIFIAKELKAPGIHQQSLYGEHIKAIPQ